MAGAMLATLRGFSTNLAEGVTGYVGNPGTAGTVPGKVVVSSGTMVLPKTGSGVVNWMAGTMPSPGTMGVGEATGMIPGAGVTGTSSGGTAGTAAARGGGGLMGLGPNSGGGPNLDGSGGGGLVGNCLVVGGVLLVVNK